VLRVRRTPAGSRGGLSSSLPGRIIGQYFVVLLQFRDSLIQFYRERLEPRYFAREHRTFESQIVVLVSQRGALRL
jgi:hypothetical protein